MKRKAKTFQEMIQKAFLSYALLPFFLFMVSVFVLLSLSVHLAAVYNGRRNVKVVCARLLEVLETYESYCGEIAGNRLLVQALEQKEFGPALGEELYGFANRQTVGCHFYVFDENVCLLFGSTTRMPDYLPEKHAKDWGFFELLKERPDQTLIAVNRKLSAAEEPGVVSVGRAVTKGGKVLGFVSFDLFEKDLRLLLKETPLSEMVITDRYGYGAAVTNKRLLDDFSALSREYREAKAASVIDGSPYSIFKEELLDGRFFVYSVTSMAFFHSAVRMLCALFLLAVGAMSLLSYILMNRISKRTTTSLLQVIDAIQQVGVGKLDHFPERPQMDVEEFQIIFRSYNQMIVEIHRLIELNKEEALRSMEAEIKALEQQFNPHFLFNTLETIRCLIKLDQKAAAEDILKLSSLLRYRINNFPKSVALKEDLEYVKQYLEILNRRFGEKFSYSLLMEEEAGAVPVPKLIVQPLIENAVNYGFHGKTELVLAISACIEGDFLALTVKDNGSGIEAKRLRQIKERLKGAENEGNAIGLYNVHRRIQLMYGSFYGIEIDSRPGEGTVVCARFPAASQGKKGGEAHDQGGFD